MLNLTNLKGVVICFHYFIFDILHTTSRLEIDMPDTLWFAFIILSLTYCTQRCSPSSITWSCCDLLSLFYLWHTAHNRAVSRTFGDQVVICFHYFIFDILHTTSWSFSFSASSLWFAFIILSLTYCTQQPELTDDELLVVICFHYFIFDILHTTNSYRGGSQVLLWFAFIILSLTYCTQQEHESDMFYVRCDLLSLFYLWHTAHNP